MYRISLKGSFFIFLILVFACSEEEVSPMEEIEPEFSNPIENTIWVSKGISCDSFFDFKESTFISSNPCYESDGEIGVMPYESGTYRVSNNRLTLTIKESCDEEKVGRILPFFYELKGDSLLLGFEFDNLVLKHISTESPPMVNENTRYGYFDFQDNGKWVHVPSCESPY